MAVNRIPRKDLLKKIQFFISRGIPYRWEETNERMTVWAEGRWGTWMNKESSFDPKFLSFIKQVKDYIKKNETYKKVRNVFKKEGSARKIKYFYYSKKIVPGVTFHDCYEIDLKGAYWETAYKMDLFDETIYKKGLEVDKRTRLAAIGSLAKVKKAGSFDGTKEKFEPDIREELTEFLWNTISHKIGKIMVKGMKASKSDFLFFWVDAVFIKGDKVKEVEKAFKSAGYECSVYKCEWVRVDEAKIIVQSKEKGKWVVKKERIKDVIDGKKVIRIIRKKVWTEERPFPYKNSGLTEKDIINLSSAQ